MPELIQECTPSVDPPLPPIQPHQPAEFDALPPAVPPAVDPTRWEDFSVFRETFLVYFSLPVHNVALRVVGNLLYELVLEYWQHWPPQPEGVTRAELRAAVADLRHVQGYLLGIAETAVGVDREPHEAHLCKLAGRKAAILGRAADEIERDLGSWRGGEE